MAKERIEEVSTEVLLKRKRFILVIAAIFMGASVITTGLILYDLVSVGEINTSSISALVPALAGFWIPVVMLSKVNAELERRNNK